MRKDCVGIALAVLLLWPTAAHTTEAPGCGNQHYRPRLSQCCPRYLAGEPMPPKCGAPLRDGFLAQCCGGTAPSPSPEPTCPEGWSCWPTPQPTPTYVPIVTDKASCCRQVRDLYQAARRAAVGEYRETVAELMRWRKEQMQACREEYAR